VGRVDHSEATCALSPFGQPRGQPHLDELGERVRDVGERLVVQISYVCAPRSYRLIIEPVSSWPVRSLIQASDFPARRAQVQDVERMSWKRSSSTWFGGVFEEDRTGHAGQP
jgi:hypothetical protein